MNEEQRAVLAAIQRMEESPGVLIDEYTVGREAGLLAADIAGHEYVGSASRARIHRTLDELDELGLVRLDREGYWRPRTTLSGRRALQRPLVALPPTRPALVPNTEPARGDGGRTIGGAVPPPAPAVPVVAPDGDGVPADRGGWPGWWPAALRFGDPSVTPIVAPIGALLALLLIVFVGARVLGGGGAAPTPTPEPVNSAALTATAFAERPIVTVTPAGSGNPAGGGPGASGAATPRPTTTRVVPTPTPAAGPPTPTAGPPTARVRVANTENKGAFVYITPAGERRFAIPEGFVLEIIGPDERDTKGQNWKHIRYGEFEGWIPEEYTTPIE